MAVNLDSDLTLHLPGPEDITRLELPNGIVVLSRADFNSPSVAISGYLRVGGLLDPDEKLGLADFTASSLMRGTQERDFHQIYDSLETVGASLSIGSGTHTTFFGGKALAEDLAVVLGLLAEALCQPLFPPWPGWPLTRSSMPVTLMVARMTATRKLSRLSSVKTW
jgi:zinc protease